MSRVATRVASRLSPLRSSDLIEFVTTSKALVTTSVALVTTSVALVTTSFLLL